MPHTGPESKPVMYRPGDRVALVFLRRVQVLRCAVPGVAVRGVRCCGAQVVAACRVRVLRRALRVDSDPVTRAFHQAEFRAAGYRAVPGLPAPVNAYLVRQVMPHAEVAGLPPVTGALGDARAAGDPHVDGFARQLSVGPESTTALMTVLVVMVMGDGNAVGRRRSVAVFDSCRCPGRDGRSHLCDGWSGAAGLPGRPAPNPSSSGTWRVSPSS